MTGVKIIGVFVLVDVHPLVGAHLAKLLSRVLITTLCSRKVFSFGSVNTVLWGRQEREKGKGSAEWPKFVLGKWETERQKTRQWIII